MSNPNPKSEFDEAMEQYEKDAERMMKEIAILDLEGKLLDAKLEGNIIPDLVFEIVKLEKEKYGKI